VTSGTYVVFIDRNILGYNIPVITIIADSENHTNYINLAGDLEVLDDANVESVNFHEIDPHKFANVTP